MDCNSNNSNNDKRKYRHRRSSGKKNEETIMDTSQQKGINRGSRAVRIIQINLNHCKEAQDLLMHTADRRKCDVMIISELYRTEKKGNWLVSRDGKAAIVIANPELVVTCVRRGIGFVATNINGI